MFFRVKFYVENINDLKFAQTRHLYYLQLRKDVLGEDSALHNHSEWPSLIVNCCPDAEGKTYCHEQPALKMASFALQAEKGNMPSRKQPYFRMEDYVPLKVWLLTFKKCNIVHSMYMCCFQQRTCTM